MELMDCKLYRLPKPKSWDDERVKLETLDIPIIDYDNALVVVERSASDSYVKAFKVSTIKSGLSFYKEQYYWFDHNIVSTPKTYVITEIHSYDIYPIKPDLASKIINTKTYENWLIKFHSHYNYGNTFLSVGSTYGSKKYKYPSKLTFDGGEKMFLPAGRVPTSLEDGQTFSEFITKNRIEYPMSIEDKATVNKCGMREVLLDFIGI